MSDVSSAHHQHLLRPTDSATRSIAYLSNENQPLPLDNDDRRHLVVYTPPALPAEFYDELNIEIDNGGVAAFYDFLLRRDLSGFHPKKRPPMTEAKQKLIALSLASELRFVNDWITGDFGLPAVPIDRPIRSVPALVPPVAVVMPTEKAMQDWASQKFDPMAKETPAIAAVMARRS